jgi:STIP1 family protein 1
MNPNYFGTGNFYDPNAPGFLNSVFSTVNSGLNSLGQFIPQQQQPPQYMPQQQHQQGYASYMDEEPRAQQYSSTSNQGGYQSQAPFDTNAFLRNFENFPEIFRPDNFFSGRVRRSDSQSQGGGSQQPNNNSQQQQQSQHQQQYYEYEPEQNPYGDSPRNYIGRGQKSKKKDKPHDEIKDKRKAEIAQAEKNPSSGHFYKKLGNDAFQKGDYQTAYQLYSRAIEINDTESVFYSNRARCCKSLKNYKKAYEDAVHAIELDETNIKAHLICGQMLAEMQKYEPGIDKLTLALNRMTKALTLCSGQGKREFEKDVYRNMLKVRKLMWYKKYEESKAVKIEMLKTLRANLDNQPDLTPEAKEKQYLQYVAAMGDPNATVDFTIPDYLVCKITFDLMEEPVTTTAGHSYEKEVLIEHIEKNGLVDPVARTPITKDGVVPNLNIKQAIEEFVKNNPWSFEHVLGETFMDIKF